MKKLLLIILISSLYFLPFQVKAMEYIHHDIQDYESTSNIICSNGCYKWKWLKENLISKYKLTGRWAEYKQVFFANSQYKIFTQLYFIVNDEKKLKEISTKCIEQFGVEYLYIHQANSIWDDWFLFRNQSGAFYEGEFNIKKQQCDLNMENCTTKKETSLYKNDLGIDQTIRKLNID
ncbi:hypothetical protein GCL60_09605 [Silvanigrella paludirubra]|uniref:Uncharacterized protein n=1 Tax=Silvanigrella paludirubra TaxID=2499159 RepID=A0A6N6VSY7_9BACT|nr:hypothetical protein [Silvanigrella paludirubra]KAB8039100.1 hypothetical protein GCL60_09605 [Silvanigrella paludirubra]